ncbi:hypothetical protein MesoLjLa_47680 [Mesorhizobium sp. L-2-11]|nr:hypothetical protein MesoLjLa_47680 [Mesorhizobium sp. L-2-11]
MMKSVIGANDRIIDSNKPASDKTLCGKHGKRLPMEFFCSWIGQNAVATPGPTRAVKADQVIEKRFEIGLRRYDGDAAAPACGIVRAAQLASPSRWNADRERIVASDRQHGTSCVVDELTRLQRRVRDSETGSTGRQVR